jgi:hypothetical protein
MKPAHRFVAILGLVSIRALLGQAPPDVMPVAAEITREATLPNASPKGYPLPLAANWNDGYGNADGFGPAYQMMKLDGGHHLLPWFLTPWPGTTLDSNGQAYYQAALQRAASFNLPISFINYNWESVLYLDPAFYTLPAAQNPNVIQLDGTIRHQADPMGPVAQWTQAGQKWGSSPMLQQIQQWYPNPPLVLFLDNNEASILPWTQMEQSQRFVNAYGPTATVDTQMRVADNGWVSLFPALQAGFRSALISPAWQSKAIFAGYNNFGPREFGRWGAWFADQVEPPMGTVVHPAPYLFGGGSPPFYLFNWDPSTDYTIWGPQGEGQNWVFMQQEALGYNANFWFEISTWDGGASNRQLLATFIPFTTDRYLAMVQFGMWMLRSRVVRDFRGTDTVTAEGIWSDAVIEAVDRVYRNPDLQRFWRHGQLVANTKWVHPYQTSLYQWANFNRWFFLDTTVDPPHPYTDYHLHLPVISLALVLGAAPNRQWLIYAHAPMGAQSTVGITIPGYTQVFVDVPVAGAFYIVAEGQASAQRVDVNASLPISVTPSSGAGSSQQFTFAFQDLDGSADLAWAQMLLSPSQSAANACYIHYQNATNSLFLYNDAVSGGAGLTPGSGTVENGQCVLKGSGSSVAVSGTTVTITLNLAFKPSFVGPKNVFGQALDGYGNLASWVRMGTWTATDSIPRLVSVSPTSGSGSPEIFTAVYRDPQGASELSWAQFLVTSSGSASNACYVSYLVSANTLFLFNDTLSSVSGLVPGSGSVENGQCVLRGWASSAALAGTDLTLTLSLAFKPGFAGPKQVGIQALDAAQNLAPWVQMGTWIAVDNYPEVVSLNPSAGTGSRQVFAGVYGEPTGAANLSWVQMLISGNGSAAGACYVHYQVSTNTLFLFNDTVTGGSGIAPGSGGTASNSQCALNGNKSSVIVSGNSLTLALDLSFKSGFSGAKSVFMQALDNQQELVPWKQMGSWTVP